MSKPLELTIHPPADPRPAGTGRDVGAWAEQRHYERNVRLGKRLTEAQLAAEWHKQDNHCGQKLEGYAVAHNGEGLRSEEVEVERLRILYRFATLPHYDQEPA